MTLHVAPVAHDAASYAVLNWHYSHKMPIGKLIEFGAWEDGRFIGVVIFGRGASPALGQPFGLEQTECCELVRIALTNHATPVTQIVALCLKMLKYNNPGMRLVVSFADPNHSHHGGIYQAGNWLYCGTTSTSDEVQFEGEWLHSRMLRPTGWGTTPRVAKLDKATQDALPRRRRKGKYRYVYPLDKAMRRQIEPLRLEPPHAVEVSEARRDDSVVEG
jgi:hypothetical protein